MDRKEPINMITATILEVKSLNKYILVRYILSNEESERTKPFNIESTSDDIISFIQEQVRFMNELEAKVNELNNQLQNITI